MVIVGLALVSRSGAAAPRDEARALVVLIGDAGASDELRSVLSELLERQGIAVEYETRARFSSNALLSENQDGRVWVFVSDPGRRVAKLYFRGPTGERFLLRRLALKSGLDELGRELIGQVVETSTVALLASDAGVSREEARAGISAEGDDTESPGDDALHLGGAPSPEMGDAGVGAHDRSRFDLDVDARGFAKWSGHELGFDHGVGAEAALAFRASRRWFVGGRAELETGFGQSIETDALDADVRATSFRIGPEIGMQEGVGAWSLGLLAGADLTKTTPKASADPTLALSGSSSGAVPVVRLEARYVLTLGLFRMTAGIFGDTSLADTHYDVEDASGSHRVAAPWPVRPGVALTLGLRSGL
jgi:hypothetical protein